MGHELGSRQRDEGLSLAPHGVALEPGVVHDRLVDQVLWHSAGGQGGGGVAGDSGELRLHFAPPGVGVAPVPSGVPAGAAEGVAEEPGLVALQPVEIDAGEDRLERAIGLDARVDGRHDGLDRLGAAQPRQ